MATPQPLQPIQPIAGSTTTANPSLTHQAMGVTTPPSLAGAPRMTMTKPTVSKLKQTATMAGKSPAMGHKVALGSVVLERLWVNPENYVPLAEEEKIAQALFPLLLAAGSQSNAGLKDFATGLLKEITENAKSIGRGVRSAGNTAISIPAAVSGHVAGKQQAMNSLISDPSKVPEIYRISGKAQEAYREALRNAFINESAKSPASLKALRFAQRNVTPLSFLGGAAGVGIGSKILTRTSKMPPEQYPAMEQNPYTDPGFVEAMADSKIASAHSDDKGNFLRNLGIAAAGTGGAGALTGAIRPGFKLPMAVSGAVLAAPIPGTTELLGAFGAGKALGASGNLATRAYINALVSGRREKAFSAAAEAGSKPIKEAWSTGKKNVISGLDAIMHPLRTIDDVTEGVSRQARKLMASAPGRSILSALRIKAAHVDSSKELLLLSRAFGGTT